MRVPSGILDQAASLLGHAGHALLLDCADLTHRPVALPADHDLLLVDSRARLELASSAYAERSAQLAEALPILGGRRPAEVDPDGLDVLVELAVDAGASASVTVSWRHRRGVTAGRLTRRAGPSTSRSASAARPERRCAAPG